MEQSEPPARPARGKPAAEPLWPPKLTVLVAVLLQLLVPDRLSAGPRWLIPALEAVLLLMMLLSTPQRLEAPHSRRRQLALAIAAVASVANGVSLVLLSEHLLRANVQNGRQLIIAGALIWLTNVLVFSLWYWELDGGGPGDRAERRPDAPDFQFPQTAAPDMYPGWRPLFADYLYVSLTTGTAFSPTDTMPLSIRAKMVMSLQTLISLGSMGLVIARAVNIL